ncbi:MAG: hypothetical protein CME07_05710 [Gemmatimonadetes bacterium]|nr:hypothetical protein [Gemmatimonadota bacterium]
MMFARGAGVALALGMLAPAGTGAAIVQVDVRERIFEGTPYLGGLFLDTHSGYASAGGLTGVRAQINNSPHWGLEATLGLGPGFTQEWTEGRLDSYRYYPTYNSQGDAVGLVFTDLQTTETPRTRNATLLAFGGSAHLNLLTGKIRPFLTLGAGFLDDISNRDEDPVGPLSNGYVELGFGMRVHRTDGLAVRLDVKDHIMRKDNLPRRNGQAAYIAALKDLASQGGADGVLGTEPFDPFDHSGRRWLHHIGVTLSVSFPFGWVWKDEDVDLVANRFDECPGTVAGVVVDPVGCGIDSDGDAIFDGLDQCVGTPLGAIVDLQGCPSDMDEDGILDGIDLCDDTPAGAFIDDGGCQYDTDGDGILDGLDVCNSTPTGSAIDDRGCMNDPDEVALLKDGAIVLRGVEYDGPTEDINPVAFARINQIGTMLRKWTTHDKHPLLIEVGVYGGSSRSEWLDIRRAGNMVQYLVEKYQGIAPNNMVSRGHGSVPEESDRELRIEFRVIGPGNAPEEYLPPEETVESPAVVEGPVDGMEDDMEAPEDIPFPGLDDDLE